MTPLDYFRAAQMMRSADLDNFAETVAVAPPPQPRTAPQRAEMQRRGTLSG